MLSNVSYICVVSTDDRRDRSKEGTCKTRNQTGFPYHQHASAVQHTDALLAEKHQLVFLERTGRHDGGIDERWRNAFTWHLRLYIHDGSFGTARQGADGPQAGRKQAVVQRDGVFEHWRVAVWVGACMIELM